MSPGISGSFADDFKVVSEGMPSPNPARKFEPVEFRRSGDTDGGDGLNTMTAIKPAIRPPPQTVGQIMSDSLMLKAIEDDLGRAVELIIAIRVWQKE